MRKGYEESVQCGCHPKPYENISHGSRREPGKAYFDDCVTVVATSCMFDWNWFACLVVLYNLHKWLFEWTFLGVVIA
jgi:hypothetical protein